jgi:hypothetical protein
MNSNDHCVRVFISWSGERSRRVAELLTCWLKCVVNAVEPWVSTEDIVKGSPWFTEIGGQLKRSPVGILCLTRENMNAPWILFEAGALANGSPKSRVCPLLIDLRPSELKGPLASFNATTPTQKDMFNLVSTINKTLAIHALPEHILRLTFDSLWPLFRNGFRSAAHRDKGKLGLRRAKARDMPMSACRPLGGSGGASF